MELWPGTSWLRGLAPAPLRPLSHQILCQCLRWEWGEELSVSSLNKETCLTLYRFVSPEQKANRHRGEKGSLCGEHPKHFCQQGSAPQSLWLGAAGPHQGHGISLLLPLVCPCSRGRGPGSSPITRRSVPVLKAAARWVAVQKGCPFLRRWVCLGHAIPKHHIFPCCLHKHFFNGFVQHHELTPGMCRGEACALYEGKIQSAVAIRDWVLWCGREPRLCPLENLSRAEFSGFTSHAGTCYRN